MLSSSVIKNVGQASHYYGEQDNYYTREEGIEQSEWWGRGAEKLALTGQIDTQQFTDLLKGILPTGEQLGKMVEGSIKHRAGWDLTFSAPKSVSILAIIGGDKRLLDAHRQSVTVALSHIERSCGQARVQTPQGMTYQNTNNLIAALYHHDLSRSKDPQLHTHSVVMNMTERSDGKWRSLASKIGSYDEKTQGEINGFIERVRHNNRYFSKLYETELAFRVKELGYEITTDTKIGIFEIADVSKEAIKLFSKRRAQIETQLAEKGLSGGKAAAVATLDTRDEKENVDRSKLQARWQIESKEIGLNCQDIIENSQKPKITQPVLENVINDNALTAVTQAAKSLSVFQTTFTLEDIVTTASEYAIRNNLNVKSLVDAVEENIRSGFIISLPNNRGKTVLMEKSTLDIERKLLDQLQDSKLDNPIIDSPTLAQFLKNEDGISTEHHENLSILLGNERIVLIEGNEARDSLVAPIIKIAKASNLNIALLSPSQIGSKYFANNVRETPKTFFDHIKSLFIDSTPKHYSVMQFLSENKERKILKNDRPDILLVDNANLLSTHQKAELFEWNKSHNTKLILLGNKDTLLSQRVGVSLNHLTETGLATISAKTRPIPADKEIEKTNLQIAINKISSNIVEVGNEDDRHYAMANHYTRLNENDRKQSWLVSHNKTTINNLNLLTHKALLEQGKLGKTDNINILLPVFVSENKGSLASSYQKGQIVRFNETYSTLNVNRGEYLRIVRHSKISNRVVLQKDNGNHVVWHPDKIAGGSGKIELFNEIKREFSVNETITINRSINAKNMLKGERMFITAINQHGIKLKNREGRVVMLDLSKPYHRHIDYGYATTLHNIAHETPTTLIAELPKGAFYTDQRRFYQVASQPKTAWIYTDDQKGFILHLEKKTGDKLTAHGSFSQAQEFKKNLHSLYDILEKQLSQHSTSQNTSVLSKTAVEAIEYAMHHLAEREAGFTHKQLMHTAMKHALGKVNTDTLAQATLAMEKAGIVLRGNRTDGTLWTTIDAVNTERAIIAYCNQDKGKFEPIASDALLEKYCDPSKLKPEQIAAVRAITQSRDRVMAVQGHPGTGKTTMLVTVADVLAANNLLTGEGYQILGLAPTHTAVKELSDRGIPAQTLDSFISTTKQTISSTKEPIKQRELILVIDEASMVSNRKMAEVLAIGHQLECRGIIPTGDTRQLPSIEGGNASQLVQTQVQTQSLTDIQRQSDNAPLLKQAVEETISYDFKAAFQTLKDSIIEVSTQLSDQNLSADELRSASRQERIARLVKDYFSFPRKERDNIQIITPGHDDRVLTNTQIREQLKHEGTLKGEDQSFSILRPKNLTQVERSHITNLMAGDILRFGRRESALIKAGEYFTIVSVNSTHNLLKIKAENGRDIVWQIPTFDKDRLSSVEVFQKESRNLQVGDVIRWGRSDKKNELLSTEAAKVIGINDHKITVKLANGREFNFDSRSSQFQHWDHGYAATVYAVQGKTKDIILAHVESFRENLTNQPSFLVALTRAVNTFRLYTDNVEKLIKTIERNTGVKLSSLEVIGQHPEQLQKKIQQKTSKNTLSEVISSPSKKEKLKENKHEFNRYSIDRIKEGLNKDAERIALEILGTPKERGSNYLKFGRNQGSLTVTIKGEKQGWFNDFETNQGGRDMLKFIQLHAGLDKREALRYAANWLGILSDKESPYLKNNTPTNPNKSDLTNEKSSKSFSDYEKRRIKLANKLANESQPIKNTLAEKYLKEYRGIELNHIPEDIRFHPNVYSAKNQTSLPALIAIARNSDGKIQSVEAIYLDPKTGDKANVPLPKQTIGAKKGASVIINQSNKLNAPTLIVEGVVTGLSIAQSLPNVNVNIALGKQMFTSIDPNMVSKKAIFCLDNDGKNLKSDNTILAAASRLSAHQKEVSFMVPAGLDLKKQDYNDILKLKGPEAIQNDFKNAISFENFYKSNNAPDINSTKISQLSNEISKLSLNQNKANLTAYKSLIDNQQQQTTDKTLSRMRDIDREI